MGKELIEKTGIKETKELLDGILELSLCLIDVFHDGFHLTDIVDIYKKIQEDPVVKDKLYKAFHGYKKIPDEIKDIDAVEGVELATCLMAYIPRLLESLQGKKR